MTYFYCSGSNTVSGDIANLPSVMTVFNCYGFNTVSGDIANLPSVMSGFLCSGFNTISGDIANLPSVMTNFLCYGSNTISDYTAGRTWANNQQRVYLAPTAGYGLSSTEVDNLLIDLANVAAWTGDKVVWLAGNNAARTAASDAAVATLQGLGVTVTTN